VGHPGAHFGRGRVAEAALDFFVRRNLGIGVAEGAPCQALGVEGLRDPERAAGGGGIGMRDQRIAEFATRSACRPSWASASPLRSQAS
jgi:hypothetical protein